MVSARTKVALVGYGVIGRRVADAIAVQPDMELAGVADVAADWRVRQAAAKGAERTERGGGVPASALAWEVRQGRSPSA